ncbi:MAG: hypothetical protein KF894_11710 [Labilithrix sp.]|nr:hypothetical protein [Labilithrix sp.]
MIPVPLVARGSLLAYRVFDAGDTILLDVAERLVPSAKRVELGGPLAEGLVIAVPAVEIALASCELVIPGIDHPLQARVSARIFHFGVVSVLYEIPLEPGTPLSSLAPLCGAIYDSSVLDARGAQHLEEIVRELATSIERPHGWHETESYTIVFVEELSGAGVDALVDSEAVAKLLLGETSDKALSVATRQDVLRNGFSYLTDDLVLIDWNSALVVEPSGSRVVPHVLELATCQLLEFRYYDGLLDRELARVYELVGRAPRILRSPFGALTRQVLRSFMELTEFTERVDNAIKSVGDVYLARVYLAAINRFRVPHWRESVETKLGLVGRAYELLKGEVEVSRAQILELTIVILICAELVAAFERH